MDIGEVTGSSLDPGTKKSKNRYRHGGVAQLVRATACHAVGRRFESGRPRSTQKSTC